MIDIVAFLLLVGVVTAALFALGRALLRRLWKRIPLLVRILASVMLAFLLAGFFSWRISKARTFQFCGDIVPRVESAAPVVALTFDDGPSPDATERILQVLADQQVHATFFLNGQAIAEHFAAAQQLVQAGHALGNHTYTHVQMLGLSLQQIEREIEMTDEQIRRAGYQGEIFFRSPYGKKFIALPYYLAKTGRKNIFWDVEPESYPEIASKAELITAHVLERVRPGSIILLHVMMGYRVVSVQAVPQIITALRQKGYRFVTVAELLQQTRTAS
jgi:peptidoglycan-N-acetylglucosamine deacetylase